MRAPQELAGAAGGAQVLTLSPLSRLPGPLTNESHSDHRGDNQESDSEVNSNCGKHWLEIV